MKLPIRLLPPSAKRPPDPLAEIVAIRADIAALGQDIKQTVSASLAQMGRDVNSSMTRLSAAMQKRPFNFEIQRDSDGFIKNIIARPA